MSSASPVRFVAVDLGGTRLRVALVDEQLHILRRLDEATDHRRGAEGVIEQLMRLAARCLEQGGLAWPEIAALGVGCPGPLDTRDGVVHSPPNMHGWRDVPLRAELAKKSGVPVVVANDANVAGLGEYHYGSGHGSRNFVYLTVSTGIGGGVVVDGRLLEGSTGSGGEIGHITLDRYGPRCNCGNIGCLEVLASGTAIARRFGERLAAGEVSILKPSATSPISARQVVDAARAGDALAAAVFEEAAETLGFGVVTCIHVFNPDVVAIGGGVAQAGELLMAPVRRIVAQHAIPIPRDAVRVVSAELGENAGLIGAGALARTLLLANEVASR